MPLRHASSLLLPSCFDCHSLLHTHTHTHTHSEMLMLAGCCAAQNGVKIKTSSFTLSESHSHKASISHINHATAFCGFRSFFPPLEAEAGGIIGNKCLALAAAAASWFNKQQPAGAFLHLSHQSKKHFSSHAR